MDGADAGLNATTFSTALLAGFDASGINGSGEIRTYDDLVAQFGKDNVDNAIANLSDQELVRAWKAQIADSEHLNEAGREAAYAELDAALEAGQRPTTDAATDAVTQLLLNNIRALNEDLAEEGAASADGRRTGSRNGAGGAGNWLVLMATAMAKVAGDHLAKALEYAKQIGTMPEDLNDIEGFEVREGEDPDVAQGRATTFLQAQMQAETQLFKMVFEAGSTLVKTAGEAFSTMARKQ